MANWTFYVAKSTVHQSTSTRVHLLIHFVNNEISANVSYPFMWIPHFHYPLGDNAPISFFLNIIFRDHHDSVYVMDLVLLAQGCSCFIAFWSCPDLYYEIPYLPLRFQLPLLIVLHDIVFVPQHLKTDILQSAPVTYYLSTESRLWIDT